MSTPKRHHYVPAWYLKGFSDSENGLLTVYDREREEFRCQKSEQVMVITHYYRQEWAPEGVDANLFEKRLACIEGSGQSSFEKLITNPRDITGDDTAAIITYLELQRLRVPRQAEFTNEMYKHFISDVAHQIPEVSEALSNGQVTLTFKDKGIRFELLRKFGGTLTPYFARMKWYVISAPEGHSFITSDSPVNFVGKTPPPNDSPISAPDTSVIFPLTSKYILVMHHPEIENGIESLQDEPIIAKEINDGVISLSSGKDASVDLLQFYNEVIAGLSKDYIVGQSQANIEQSLRYC